MPVDPVCGIELDEDLALLHDHDGKKFYFCSSFWFFYQVARLSGTNTIPSIRIMITCFIVWADTKIPPRRICKILSLRDGGVMKFPTSRQSSCGGLESSAIL